MAQRLSKSLKNARVNLLFYGMALILAFFSRRIFLERLGDDFVGLYGTMASILGYLNLAEMGTGAAVSYFLYQPLAQGDWKRISDIVSLLGKMYQRIGLFVLVAGALVGISFIWIFPSAISSMGWSVVFMAYAALMISALTGYFLNYRQILLAADQKNYIVSAYLQGMNLIKVALQICMVKMLAPETAVYAWIMAEMLLTVAASVLLNIKIKNEYPQLGELIGQQQGDDSANNELVVDLKRKVRQVFLHKVKDFMLRQGDEVWVYMFVSLKMVARYGNYTIIVGKMTLLMNMALDGMTAAVGNLVAEGNKKHTVEIFWQLTALRYFIAATMALCLLMVTPSFIRLWVGPEYLLSGSVLGLLAAFTWLQTINGAVYMYLHAYGLYADMWAMYAELGINVILTVVCGSLWGIEGILVAKVVSTLLIITLWKPCYLFSKGLGEPLILYWKGTGKHILITAISMTIGYAVAMCLGIERVWSWKDLVTHTIVLLVVFISVYIPLAYYWAPGMKGLMTQGIKILKRKRSSCKQ